MRIRGLHAWDLSYQQAVAVQERLSGQVQERALPRPVETVAGADASYGRRGQEVFAAVLVFTFPELVLVEEAAVSQRVDFPYIPGLLSFREAPALVKAFREIGQKPDVVIFDGQGIAHPRGMGLASHMGLLLDCPSIGCAKTRLVGSYPAPHKNKGSSVPLRDQGKIVGEVVRTRQGVKPVFVSPGYAITLSEAVQLVLECCRGYRLPEPTRQAHLSVNRLRLEKQIANSRHDCDKLKSKPS